MECVGGEIGDECRFEIEIGAEVELTSGAR